MNLKEKVELINTLHQKVIDYDADGETCYYIIVPLDEETFSVLKTLGFTNEEIINTARADIENNNSLVIDIAPFGFKFAKWWQSDTGFSLRNPRREGINHEHG